MGWINWKMQKEFQKKVDWEKSVCDREGTSEDMKTKLYDSEHKILINNRHQEERSESLEPVLDRMDKNIAVDQIRAFEEEMDRKMMPEEDQWLADIKTEELRTAIEQMTSSQKELIKLLLAGYSQREAAQVLGITEAAVVDRINKIRSRLSKTLSPTILHVLCAGRKN